MTIRIDLNADIPIYQQLRDQLILGIADGRLRPGEQLPSVRQFGADLGINLHTVNKVYNLLRQEGFLTAHRQRGVVVSDPRNRQETPAYRQQLESVLLPVVAQARCRGVPLEELVAVVSRQYGSFDHDPPTQAQSQAQPEGK